MEQQPDRELSDKTIEQYRHQCWIAAEQCRIALNQITAKRTSKDDVRGWMRDVQEILPTFADALLFTGDSSLSAIMRSILPGFKASIGLISTVDVLESYSHDRDCPAYRFMLGSDDEWSTYLRSISAETITCDGIRADLQGDEGVKLSSNRIYGQKNATGALLQQPPPAGIDPTAPAVVGWAHSALGEKSLPAYPWALLKFPMVYAVIAAAARPLGFLLLSIEGTRDDDKYTGEDSTWLNIYDPRRGWVKSLGRLSSSFANVFLAPLAARAVSVCQEKTHSVDVSNCFPSKLRTALGIGADDPLATGYDGSMWKTEIEKLHALLREPTYSLSELAKSTISCLWSQCELSEEREMGARSTAESALFLSESYRDHLIHILKVFLIGERLLHQICCEADPLGATKHIEDFANKHLDVGAKDALPCKSPLQKFEMLWMLAATIHDFSIPCQLLPDLQESCWRKFFAEEPSAAEGPRNRDLEQFQFGLGLTNRIFRQHLIVNLWQVLHVKMLPQGMDPVVAHTDMLRKEADSGISPDEKMLYPQYLKYFLETGDHGIASALWFLHQHHKNIHGSTDDKKKEKKKQQSHSAISVARACYFHSLATKAKSKGSLDHYFREPVIGTFQEDPLSYLLLLSDFLQDEGRMDGHFVETAALKDSGVLWSGRPLGHIENIGLEGDVLVIRLVYCWVGRTKEHEKWEHCLLGERWCGQKPSIPCKHRKDNPGKPCPTKCPDAEALKDCIEHLFCKRLKGLRVKLLLSDPPRSFALYPE